MYFKTSIKGITTEQLAVINAIQTLYHEQNMACIVLSLEPLTFELKPQLSMQMRKRLIFDRVPFVVEGYKAKLEGSHLVVSPEESKPTRGRRKGTGTGDLDLRAS